MSILVTYASKHGATKGIAERIAQALHHEGREVALLPIDAVRDVGSFEAVVIGSAVYYGSWLKDAVEFVRGHQALLATRPVWLFSCGPLGTEVHDNEQQPKELGDLQVAVGARDHRLFFGALDTHTLSFPERMVVKAVRAPEGDYRDWNAIEAWATGIAASLPLHPERPGDTTLPGGSAGSGR